MVTILRDRFVAESGMQRDYLVTPRYGRVPKIDVVVPEVTSKQNAPDD
ncbi:MAG TPA: hypothetical protein VGP65_11785 [Candidatus Angelobacter sp.]|jgi:hypothetical protein|nr:hypothetical protein [Candidatus Angelobacter sp.]